MTQNEFLVEMEQALGAPAGRLAPETELRTLAEWDSMGQMGLLTLLDASFQVSLPPGALSRCVRVADVLALVDGRLAR